MWFWDQDEVYSTKETCSWDSCQETGWALHIVLIGLIFLASSERECANECNWNTSAIRSWLFYKKCSQNKETIRWGSPPPVQEASKFQVQMKQSAVIAVVMDEPLTGVQKAEEASRQIHSNCLRKLERKSSEATNVSPLSQVCEPFSRLSRLESNRPHMHTHLPSPLCLSDAAC